MKTTYALCNGDSCYHNNKPKSAGAPLADADVSFYPQSTENKKWATGGRTDESGKLQVMTMGKYKGMPADTYRVTVMKTHIENAPMKEDDPPGEVFFLVDKKFMTESTTDLTITVESGGEQTFDLDVGAPVRVK